jgi:hypothetical protein
MTKISWTMVSLLGMTGLVSAQGATKAPASKVADTKAEAPTEMPKPPAEIALAAKSKGGRWRCTGIAMGGPDMRTEMKFTGTQTSKLELDGWWIHDAFNGTIGTGKTAMKFKMESYATYDGNTKKWRMISVMNDGGSMMGTSEGMKDGRMDITSEAYSMMGTGTFKEHIDMSDPKAGVKTWGEMSMDRGKTWNKVFEITCRR